MLALFIDAAEIAVLYKTFQVSGMSAAYTFWALDMVDCGFFYSSSDLSGFSGTSQGEVSFGADQLLGRKANIPKNKKRDKASNQKPPSMPGIQPGHTVRGLSAGIGNGVMASHKQRLLVRQFHHLTNFLKGF